MSYRCWSTICLWSSAYSLSKTKSRRSRFGLCQSPKMLYILKLPPLLYSTLLRWGMSQLGFYLCPLKKRVRFAFGENVSIFTLFKKICRRKEIRSYPQKKHVGFVFSENVNVFALSKEIYLREEIVLARRRNAFILLSVRMWVFLLCPKKSIFRIKFVLAHRRKAFILPLARTW